MFSYKFCGALFLISLAVELSMACNGYKASIVKLEHCAGTDAIVTIDPNFSVTLNKKCELVPNGCIMNKAFNTANVKYKVQKDKMVLAEGQMDACKMAENVSAEAKSILKMFGAPSKCPVAEEKICSDDHKVDLTNYKGMLGMARGHIIIDTDIEHDTGKSCFHAEVEITKK